MSITRRTAVCVRALLVAASAAALIAPATVAVADDGEHVRAYTCDNLRADGSERWDGFGDCEVARGDLPRRGPVYGDFEIRHKHSDFVVLCTADRDRRESGFAELPRHVEGHRCAPVRR
ncbi:hypothetical protein LN042_13830 [Kitasatospora sp. RB6PN24]|uniref:hypothetical protein n=1 Tax=Kitasatospora humi TaxID=2893891 RepID=UPI001E4FF03E|nr:hypothetical protein [Kitasatospora humi]MCC9308154.1 hypothetical protein [Kitasatospora humi]